VQRVFIGYDRRELESYVVSRLSVIRNTESYVEVRPLVLERLREMGLYDRPTTVRGHQLWDDISVAPMATEFAISRFLVPTLSNYEGWSLFMDGDIMIRSDLTEVFSQYADPEKAVICVKHNFDPDAETKMDNQQQTRYARKNWSSFMLFNCAHPANRALDVELVNSVPGRDLHGFCWLEDDEIGELPTEWNYLVGHSDPTIDAKAVHFTDGPPCFDGYEDVEYADEYNEMLLNWVLGR
jgi:hypothetical protein